MRVVIIGAGMIGACTAYAAARAGLDVIVLDRDAVGSGTTSRGEGNILVSDKEPGPELDLALASRAAWDGIVADVGADALEFEAKGGVIVASSATALDAVEGLAAGQRACGVRADAVADPCDLEPHLAPGLAGAVHYPQDAQVQPVLAAAAILAAAQRRGAVFRPKSEATGLRTTRAGAVSGVRTGCGDVWGADAVVNAAGTWSGVVGERLGAPIPVLPRRGFVLVTEPLPTMIGHKVYAAEYIDNVGSSADGLQSSPVVEGTPGGTILIGSSRERVGFDERVSTEALGTIARNAAALFPFLANTRILRHYHGFRPYCIDHLPVIGPDPRAPGLWHACGHEGAGIGLSVGTGKLLAQAMSGAETDLDLAPFAPERFERNGGIARVESTGGVERVESTGGVERYGGAAKEESA